MLTTKDQHLGQRTEGKVIDSEEDMCEELNTKSQIIFTLEDSQVPRLPDWEGDYTLENIEMKPLEVRRLMNELDKSYRPDGICTSGEHGDPRQAARDVV